MQGRAVGRALGLRGLPRFLVFLQVPLLSLTHLPNPFSHSLWVTLCT